jgi:hypothetical protein
MPARTAARTAGKTLGRPRDLSLVIAFLAMAEIVVPDERLAPAPAAATALPAKTHQELVTAAGWGLPPLHSSQPISPNSPGTANTTRSSRRRSS